MFLTVKQNGTSGCRQGFLWLSENGSSAAPHWLLHIFFLVTGTCDTYIEPPESVFVRIVLLIAACTFLFMSVKHSKKELRNVLWVSSLLSDAFNHGAHWEVKVALMYNYTVCAWALNLHTSYEHYNWALKWTCQNGSSVTTNL